MSACIVREKNRTGQIVTSGKIYIDSDLRTVSMFNNPRANDAKRRSGRKPGARVTNSARLFTPG